MPPVDTEKPSLNERLSRLFSRSSYFFAALLLHIVGFVLLATYVIFPAFNPPQSDFNKSYLPPASPPPPPPPPSTPTMVPTQTMSAPTTITSPNPTASFSVPMPDLTPTVTPTTVVKQQMTQAVTSKPNQLSAERLAKIKDFEQTYRDKSNILESDGDPHNVVMKKFPVYLASYADGDWGCNVYITPDTKAITAGSLPNLVAKINEWSRGNISGEVEPQPLSIGGPDLLAKRPPFIFFTGHKDFKLTETEVKNLQDYLQEGGCIWGDNALPGWGSRFDVAFRREMKRVVPDVDKNFEPVKMDDPVFTKSWFPITKLPQGMNYYSENLWHLDIDGKLAIFLTPNDYSDMFWMRILPGDLTIVGGRPVKKSGSPLFTSSLFLSNSRIYFRNFTLQSCLACDQLGMNIIGYLLVRFDKELLLTP